MPAKCKFVCMIKVILLFVRGNVLNIFMFDSVKFYKTWQGVQNQEIKRDIL